MKVVREPFLAEKVVFVDGLPGCGKTMLSPIIGSLPRVQLLQYSYEIEYICSLRFLNKIEKDAAVVLVKMLTDLKLYNVMMSRDTNFRFSDISSVFKNARVFLYLKRLFQRGDGAVIDRLQKERPILHLTTHIILPFCEPILTALGSRAVILEVIRHPLYMLKQQILYQDRFGTDPRDFTIWYQYKERAVPYFALGWEDIFLNANATDKAIYMIHHLTKRIRQLDFSVFEIPFEKFVLNPGPFMEEVERLLGTKMDKTTRRMMKRQRVPRRKVADGIALGIYKKYGWKPSKRNADEREELNARRNFVAKQASKEAMKILNDLCQEYEEKHRFYENDKRVN